MKGIKMNIAHNQGFKYQVNGYYVHNGNHNIAPKQEVYKMNTYNPAYYKDYNINFKGTNNITKDITKVLSEMADLVNKNPEIMNAFTEREISAKRAVITLIYGIEMFKKSPETILKLLKMKNEDYPKYYKFEIEKIQDILKCCGDNDKLLNKALAMRDLCSADSIVNTFNALKNSSKLDELFNKKRPDGIDWLNVHKPFEYLKEKLNEKYPNGKYKYRIGHWGVLEEN